MSVFGSCCEWSNSLRSSVPSPHTPLYGARVFDICWSVFIQHQFLIHIILKYIHTCTCIYKEYFFWPCSKETTITDHSEIMDIYRISINAILMCIGRLYKWTNINKAVLWLIRYITWLLWWKKIWFYRSAFLPSLVRLLCRHVRSYIDWQISFLSTSQKMITVSRNSTCHQYRHYYDFLESDLDLLYDMSINRKH